LHPILITSQPTLKDAKQIAVSATSSLGIKNRWASAAALIASHNHAEITKKNLAETEKNLAKLTQQAEQLDGLLLKLMRSAKFHQEPSSTVG